ncbi:hypothetical protein CCYA_CCYA06G1774 [Cyanidiococcus yangmingshanensis]|nr:hypothetical protein CCYA_CCYA06G1774 [Cyanidiococcus yangmingshanensis]
MVGSRPAGSTDERPGFGRPPNGVAELLSTFFEPTGPNRLDQKEIIVRQGIKGLSDASLLAPGRHRARNSRGVLQPSALENTRQPKSNQPPDYIIDRMNENSGLWADELVLSPGTKATLQRAALLSRDAPRQSSLPSVKQTDTNKASIPATIESPPSPPPEEDFCQSSTDDCNSSTEGNVLIQTTSFTQTTIILSERKRRAARGRDVAPTEASDHAINRMRFVHSAPACEEATESEKERVSASLAVTIGDSSDPSLTGLSSPRYRFLPEKADPTYPAGLANDPANTSDPINATADISAILAAHSGLVRKYANMSALAEGAETNPKRNASELVEAGPANTRRESRVFVGSPLPENASACTTSATWGPSPVVFWEPAALHSRRESLGPVTILAWKTKPQFRDAVAAFAHRSALALPDERSGARRAIGGPGAPRPNVELELTSSYHAIRAAAQPSFMPAAAKTAPLRVPLPITPSKEKESPPEQQCSPDRRPTEMNANEILFDIPSKRGRAGNTRRDFAKMTLTDEAEFLDERGDDFGFLRPKNAATPPGASIQNDHGSFEDEHEIAELVEKAAFHEEGNPWARRQLLEHATASITSNRERGIVPMSDNAQKVYEGARSQAGHKQQRPTLNPLSLPAVDIDPKRSAPSALTKKNHLPPRIPRGDKSFVPSLAQQKELGNGYLPAQRQGVTRETLLPSKGADVAHSRPVSERTQFAGRHRPTTVPKTPHLETERRARLRAAAAAAQADAARAQQVRGSKVTNAGNPSERWRPRITVPQTPNVLRHTNLCRRERPKTREELDLEEMERGRRALLSMREANERSRRRCMRQQTCAVYGTVPFEHWPDASESTLAANNHFGIERQMQRTVSLGGPVEHPEWVEDDSTPQARRLTMPAWSETIPSAYTHSQKRIISSHADDRPHSPGTLGLFRNLRR